MAKASEQKGGNEGGSKRSLVSRVIPVLLVTIIAGGGGFLEGTFFRDRAASGEAPKTSTASASEQTVPAATSEAHAPEQKAEIERDTVRALAPIVSNLGSPSETWMRLEISILMHKVEQADQDETAVKAADAVVAFLRTVSLKSIEGPTGFTHFREDLSDMLKNSFDGKITGVLIGSMVVE